MVFSFAIVSDMLFQVTLLTKKHIGFVHTWWLPVKSVADSVVFQDQSVVGGVFVAVYNDEVI